jgi:hypothetical protein
MKPKDYADVLKAALEAQKRAEEEAFGAAHERVKTKQAANNASIACDEGVGLKTCHKCGVVTVRSVRVWHLGLTLVDYCPECAKKIPCQERQK